MHKIFNLLKTNRFLPLFITQFLGAFNDNVYRNALAVLIMFHINSISADDKAFYSSIAIAVFMLPFFLFSAAAGILADKYNKARLIRITKFIEMIVMGFGVIGFLISNIYLLFAVLFLTGVMSTFFGPLKYSILPDHLKDDELLAGNSLVEAGTFIAIILGTVVGGVVISENSASLGFAGGVVFGLALVSYLATHFIPKTEARETLERPSVNILKDIYSVIKIAKSNQRVFRVIIGLSWFWLIGAVLMSQMLEMTKSFLGANQQVYTLILTLFCVGIGVGSIACNIILKGVVSARLVPICIFLISIFMFDFAYSLSNFPKNSSGLYNVTLFLEQLSAYRILFDLFAISLLGGIYSVPLYAIMQHDSEQKNRSKIIAANNIINSLFMVVASLLCTILITQFKFNLPLVFSMFSALNLGVSYYAFKTIK
jgi:acyl-[acyl-carrier-protein]-phospholipid O-acyltransferase/long-chain-fatty-acid--[acyl-carrier-protein] ligase